MPRGFREFNEGEHVMIRICLECSPKHVVKKLHV